MIPTAPPAQRQQPADFVCISDSIGCFVRMDQHDQLVSRQRPPTGDRRAEPDWYRNTDTSTPPGLGSPDRRQQREDFATTRVSVETGVE